MYQIKTEQDYTIRTYTAYSYFDAVDLFNNLSKVLPFVQVWIGDKVVMEYKLDNSDWAEKAEAHQHSKPLCAT